MRVYIIEFQKEKKSHKERKVIFFVYIRPQKRIPSKA